MAFRFGIGFKLGLASSVIILLSAGVIVSRQIAMSRIEAADSDVQRQSEILDEAEKVSIRLGNIRADLAEMRLSFANLGNDDLAKEIALATSAVQTHLDRLLELETHDDDREVFRTLKARFTEIGSAAAAVHASQTAQLNAVDARPAIRMRARSAFSALAMDLESAGKANAARAVATLDPLLDQITLASALFLIEEDPKQLTMIKVIDDTGIRTLAGMEGDVRADPRAAETLILAREAFAAYTKSIQDGIAELQARTALVQRRAAPAMADAVKLLAEVTRESAQQTVEADHDADVAVDSGLFQILIFSILAIFASIASAAYSAFGIARPVQRMSEAMEQLSSGATAVEIPYADRSDEVGDQARALTVFRDRLAETARLRSERRGAEQAAAAQRKADMNDLADQFERAVGAVVDMVASAATELQTAAETLSSTAAETTAQATAVAGAATLATTNVQTVAAAIEELSASARDIGTRLRESTRMTERAVTEVDNTNDQMSELRASADQIGTIIGVIDTIAGQTNLLALNATIESARAGEAGRGFAVVAQEVKTLAGQTAKATADISARISGIQDSTGDVLGAITGFSRTISALSAGSMAIASAMEEQNATTAEVARSIQQAAAGTHEVTATIVGVEQAAHASSAAASQVLTSATDLSAQAELLRAQVKTFLTTVRAA